MQTSSKLAIRLNEYLMELRNLLHFAEYLHLFTKRFKISNLDLKIHQIYICMRIPYDQLRNFDVAKEVGII
jgi:hypothetical protein